MKNFSDFINEDLGFDIDQNDNVFVNFYDVKAELHVSKDGNRKDIITLLPTENEHKFSYQPSTPGQEREYTDHWSVVGMHRIVNELKKAGIEYREQSWFGKKGFDVWIQADLNLNLMAKLYLQDKYNIT